MPFDTTWDAVLSAVTDRRTDNIEGNLYNVQIEKSEEMKYLLQVYAQDATFGDNIFIHICIYI